MASALDHAVDKAKEIWDAGRARGGPFTWLLRRIRPGFLRPVEGVWICQHVQGNWETAHCKGQPTHVWQFREEGVVTVASLPDLDMTAIASKTPYISFCVDDAGNRMIYQEWYGPRAGWGGVLVLKKNGKWAETKHSWIS